MRLLHLRSQIMGLDPMYSSAGGYGPCRLVPLLQTIDMTNGNEFAWMGQHPPIRVCDINPYDANDPLQPLPRSEREKT